MACRKQHYGIPYLAGQGAARHHATRSRSSAPHRYEGLSVQRNAARELAFCRCKASAAYPAIAGGPSAGSVASAQRDKGAAQAKSHFPGVGLRRVGAGPYTRQSISGFWTFSSPVRLSVRVDHKGKEPYGLATASTGRPLKTQMWAAKAASHGKRSISALPKPFPVVRADERIARPPKVASSGQARSAIRGACRLEFRRIRLASDQKPRTSCSDQGRRSVSRSARESGNPAGVPGIAEPVFHEIPNYPLILVTLEDAVLRAGTRSVG